MSSQPRVPPVASGQTPSRLAHVPALETAFWTLYGELWSHGALDHRTKEVARIRNARVTNCSL
jgi:hypothetical protein